MHPVQCTGDGDGNGFFLSSAVEFWTPSNYLKGISYKGWGQCPEYYEN